MALVAMLSVADAVPAPAQRPAPTEAACYHMVYHADSADSPLPHGFQWSAKDSAARFWWDSLGSSAREVRKQTRGRGPWRRGPGDSISVSLWSLESGSYGFLRFAPARAPHGGVVAWMSDGHLPIERYVFSARPIACPQLDPPANKR